MAGSLFLQEVTIPMCLYFLYHTGRLKITQRKTSSTDTTNFFTPRGTKLLKKQ